jgi:hypothetical protein
VFNWRIVLGGAASAAVLAVGVAAPALAAPRASSPVPLNGITQGLSGSQASGVFCGLPELPLSVGVTSAAGAIGESCGSAQANGSSQSILTQSLASAPQDGRQGASQDIGLSSGQANGPARTASAPQASGASSAISGLNSLSGAIPDLGNAAGAVPSGNGSPTDVANLIPGNGPGGVNSVSNAVNGVTGSLPGGQNGGTGTGTMP